MFFSQDGTPRQRTPEREGASEYLPQIACPAFHLLLVHRTGEHRDDRVSGLDQLSKFVRLQRRGRVRSELLAVQSNMDLDERGPSRHGGDRGPDRSGMIGESNRTTEALMQRLDGVQSDLFKGSRVTCRTLEKGYFDILGGKTVDLPLD